MRDSPFPNTDPHPTPEQNFVKGKVKKNKKKKRHRSKSQTSASSSSSDVGIPALVLDEPAREEFYDAHESYHGLPENLNASPLAVPPSPLNPVTSNQAAGGPLMATCSEYGPDPKLELQESILGQTQSADLTRKIPSTISKSISRPK